jgi:hypothetical protein
MAEVNPTHLARHVWNTLLTVRAGDRGPIPIRHAPLLATGDLGGVGVPVSSILCPSGLRASIAASFGLPREAVRIMEPFDEAGADWPELRRLRADAARFAGLDQARQAEVLACLNCLTEQDTAIRVARGLTAAYLNTPAGCRVLYEAARALIRRRPEHPRSREVLARIAADGAEPWIRTAALVQLGAAAVRIDRNPTAAEHYVAAAERMRADTRAGVFLDTLLHSRVSRLAALISLKNGDPAGQGVAMATTLETATTLIDLAAPLSAYERLVAAENLKMVVEAHLKAAGGARDAAGVERWATTMLSLDPDDPSTWRDIAANAARCGLVTEAALALVGLAHVGGAGAAGLLGAVTSGTDRHSAPGLAALLIDAIGALGQSADHGVDPPSLVLADPVAVG